jgi:hypothetical protein
LQGQSVLDPTDVLKRSFAQDECTGQGGAESAFALCSCLLGKHFDAFGSSSGRGACSVKTKKEMIVTDMKNEISSD